MNVKKKLQNFNAKTIIPNRIYALLLMTRLKSVVTMKPIILYPIVLI